MKSIRLFRLYSLNQPLLDPAQGVGVYCRAAGLPQDAEVTQ
ncbi:MAG: hypothetical protein ACAI34_06890 [Verrucomicrobium sp.]|nr:hypothetical protein [Verrucomicrobium sp.]